MARPDHVRWRSWASNDGGKCAQVTRERAIVAARAMIALGAALALFALRKQGAIGLTVYLLPAQSLILLGMSAYGIGCRLKHQRLPRL